MAYQFFGKCHVILGSGGVCVIQDGGQTVAWGFAQFDVALYDGVEHQFLEVAFHFIVNLVGLAQARVVHRQQETFDFECRVQFRLDNLDGVQQFADTFQCKVFRLYGDNHGVGCGERVDGNQSQ